MSCPGRLQSCSPPPPVKGQPAAGTHRQEPGLTQPLDKVGDADGRGARRQVVAGGRAQLQRHAPAVAACNAAAATHARLFGGRRAKWALETERRRSMATGPVKRAHACALLQQVIRLPACAGRGAAGMGKLGAGPWPHAPATLMENGLPCCAAASADALPALSSAWKASQNWLLSHSASGVPAQRGVQFSARQLH